MKRLVLIMIVGFGVAFSSVFAQRVNSMRKKLTPVVPTDTIESLIDTIKIVDATKFNVDVVTMLGFSKRAGESKESFLLMNHSNLYLSRVAVLLCYYDTKNVLFHEREVMIECELPPYSSRVVSIKTFDEGHNFYYYKTKNLKEDAVAFDVRFTLLRYDIIVKES